MNRIEPGMIALGLDDRRLGVVASVRHCCFEVVLENPRTKLCLTRSAVFNVDMRVTLICMNDEAPRYACPIHQPRRMGVAS